MNNKEYKKAFIDLIKVISTFNYRDGNVRFSSKIPDRMSINRIAVILGMNTTDFNNSIEILETLGVVKEVNIDGERYLDISSKLINKIIDGNKTRDFINSLDYIPTNKDFRKIRNKRKKGNKY